MKKHHLGEYFWEMIQFHEHVLTIPGLTSLRPESQAHPGDSQCHFDLHFSMHGNFLRPVHAGWSQFNGDDCKGSLPKMAKDSG